MHMLLNMQMRGMGIIRQQNFLHKMVIGQVVILRYWEVCLKAPYFKDGMILRL